jgi:protein-tyrosine phosphatase
MDTETLRGSGITHVLSIGARGPGDGDGFVCLRLGLLDSGACTAKKGSSEADNPCSCSDDNLLALLPECMRFIDSAVRGTSSNVYVHCKAGISRSAAVVVAYAMLDAWRQAPDLPVPDPIAVLDELRRRSGRPLRPNESFLHQLVVWQSAVPTFAQCQ